MENKQTNQMCLFVTETLLTCLIGSGCLLCADVSAVVDSLLIQPHMKQCLMSQEHTAFKQKTLKYRQQEHSDPEQIKHRRYVSW